MKEKTKRCSRCGRKLKGDEIDMTLQSSVIHESYKLCLACAKGLGAKLLNTPDKTTWRDTATLKGGE